MIARAMCDKAVSSGKVSAAQVAEKVFEAIAAGEFYIYSHPHALGNVRERAEHIVALRDPADPYATRPDFRAKLQAALRT